MGEDDPRWIVEERSGDGKNINGWHWQEVNRMAWSKQRLGELLPGTEAAGSGGGWSARITAVTSVTGDAMLTTRKGNKRFAFYDLKLSLAWEAAPAAPATDGGAATVPDEAADGEAAAQQAEAAASGTLDVAEFGSGSDHDDIEITVTAKGGSGSSADKDAAARHARQALWPAVLQRLEQFARELAES
ncbi:activator of 90 kDa heat shock ATPase-like protein 1 [Micractinium conductrix]|uniref:Activator of 90 kDa heat shock ATPase-like protein 1 n=1 Tax=Micractinium conductrix TaxID=554055 RepID=A0A2P6VL92_9CHLO|nr:activator of 90 kDa heat shock ATPase-like protein 1 [Micractinium conductrix]|eukprot:PSC74859.1 activator of 90 kDa heat shock ATPase-like protein 1 [Micractinium conductrix]